MSINAPNDLTPILSISPITIAAPDRLADLQLRLAVPAGKSNLPVILLSHGHVNSNNLASLNGNLPLIDYWTAQGFAVIQPTHLNSKSLKLSKDVPGWPLFWESRVKDMKFILDHLDLIESYLPTGSGTFDRERIAIAGVSLGSHTVAMMIGAQQTDIDTQEIINLSDSRIKAGVIMSSLGGGGSNLSEFVTKTFPFYTSIDFSTMSAPAIVFYGDADHSPELTHRGAEWHADPYLLSPGPKALINMKGCGHYLGGIIGYDAAATTDEDPARVILVAKLAASYLRSILYEENENWIEDLANIDPNLASFDIK